MFRLLLGWVSVGLDAEFGMHGLILLALSTLQSGCGFPDLVPLS